MSLLRFRLGRPTSLRGWQTLMPGSCENSQITLSGNERVYVYAQSDDIYAGSGQRFEGNEQFCVSFKGDFDIDGRRECRERGFTSADFANVDTQSAQPQISFSDLTRLWSQTRQNSSGSTVIARVRQ